MTERQTSLAVRAVCLLSRTRISSGRSSHASKQRAQPHLLLLLVLLVVHGPRQPAVQHTQRGTVQSSVKRAVQPMCHTHFMEGRKKAPMEACEGPVPRRLVPAMDGSGPVTRRHKQVGEEMH